MALPPALAWTEGRKATADSLRVFSVDDLTSTGYLSCLTVDFTGWVANIRLFLGQPVNRDDQRDHHQYADHRPNPHPSAHPFRKHGSSWSPFRYAASSPAHAILLARNLFSPRAGPHDVPFIRTKMADCGFMKTTGRTFCCAYSLETLAYRDRGNTTCNFPLWSVALAKPGSTSKGSSTIRITLVS